mgnify:CR=1 FL=1
MRLAAALALLITAMAVSAACVFGAPGVLFVQGRFVPGSGTPESGGTDLGRADNARFAQALFRWQLAP